VAVVFGSAPSQDETLAALAAAPGIDWKRVTAFHLDEYVGATADAQFSFRHYLADHLFGALELRACFADHFVIEDLRGLDLFHSRFALDPRWNPGSVQIEHPFRDHLTQLEDAYSQTPGFMERATHLLLVGRRRHPEDPAS
jgi:hypothetical protein